MATDLSRSAFDPRKLYRGVRMQMGRALTDDDFNSGGEITEEEHRHALLDVIGASGTPDDGFLLAGPTVTGGAIDFSLTAGTLYLGGLRLETDGSETFQVQDDWLQQDAADRPGPPGANERFDLVWIEAVLQDVTAMEDSELLEVALGAWDTSARTRVVRRIRVAADVGAADCRAAWAALLTDLAATGSVDETLELRGDDTLTVTYAPPGPGDDLCSPSVAGGYLGAENQAIRVQLVDDGSALTWGFDNSTPLYRVQVLTDAGGQRTVISMLTEPPDQYHWPMAGQVVELLPWGAVLPNGEKVAERSGLLARVAGSYDPDTGRFTLAAPVHAGFGEAWKGRPDAAELGADEFFFLRVWNRGADTASPLAIPCPTGTAVALGQTGVNVTIDGSRRPAGDHWVIAARPHTPTQVVPWELETGRAPHGYRRWIAPLGVIRWPAGAGTGVLVDDCREWFPPLTRVRTCCTYTVGDGVASHGRFESIQAAIDALPAEGGQVCLLPGVFQESVRIVGRRDVVLSGCGRRSVIVAEPPPEEGAEAEPAIRVRRSQRIVIRDLAVLADAAGPGVLVEGGAEAGTKRILVRRSTIDVRLSDLAIGAATRGAIEIHGGQAIQVRDCLLRMDDVATAWPALFFVADDGVIEGNEIIVEGVSSPDRPFQATAALGGIQIGGTSDRVLVRGNRIQGGIGNGITLGSVRAIDDNGDDLGIVIGWVVNAQDPCSPCKPGDIVIVVDGGGEGEPPRLVSAGPLHDIRIDDNRILDMGLNGIGPVGYFDPETGELISVVRLDITGNQIRRCLWRPLAELDERLLEAAGYGGVAVPDVTRLVARENVIEGNGPDASHPVCGVFVLHGEAIEIAANRIVGNGAATERSLGRVLPGRRGGIVVVACTSAGTGKAESREGFLEPVEPALHVCDNVVSCPLGAALEVVALGPVLIHGNHLVSEGVPPGRQRPGAGTTVTIVQLAGSPELGVQYGGGFTHIATGSTYTPHVAVASGTSALLGAFGAAARQPAPNGNVLFADNQCLLLPRNRRATEVPQLLATASVVVLSLDEAGFSDNQCDCRLDGEAFVLTDLFALGWSVRVVGNRFKEGLADAALSAATLGVMNMTAHNQATHCLRIVGLPALTVRTPNTELIEAFAPGLCDRFNGLFGGEVG
jgi:hypothetical protein